MSDHDGQCGQPSKRIQLVIPLLQTTAPQFPVLLIIDLDDYIGLARVCPHFFVSCLHSIWKSPLMCAFMSISKKDPVTRSKLHPLARVTESQV
jgi:hypothetical protein